MSQNIADKLAASVREAKQLKIEDAPAKEAAKPAEKPVAKKEIEVAMVSASIPTQRVWPD